MKSGWVVSEEYTRLVRSIAEEYGHSYGGLVFVSKRMKRILGRAYPRTGEIVLSEGFLEENEEEKIREILKHELAHILAKNGLHTSHAFRKLCRQMGTTPFSCDPSAKTATPRYLFKCDNDHEFRYWKQPQMMNLVGPDGTVKYRRCKCGADIKLIKEE